MAASRLIFAVARDGVLPLSHWIGQVDHQGQPRNAVTVMYVFGAAILCTILPSQVAFYSLISAGGVPTIAAYGLIGLLRLTRTPNDFRSSYFYLGRFRKVLYALVVVWCALIVAVSSLHVRPMIMIDGCRRLCFRRSFSLRRRRPSTLYVVCLVVIRLTADSVFRRAPSLERSLSSGSSVGISLQRTSGFVANRLPKHLRRPTLALPLPIPVNHTVWLSSCWPYHPSSTRFLCSVYDTQSCT